jgi:hypothetical protein
MIIVVVGSPEFAKAIKEGLQKIGVTVVDAKDVDRKNPLTFPDVKYSGNSRDKCQSN